MKQIAGRRGPEDLATSKCGGAGTCPAVFLTEDGNVVVQGRKLTEAAKSLLCVAQDEDAVEVSVELFKEAMANLE